MRLRQTVITVAILNFSYFVIEVYFGNRFDSVALLSDSFDFLEDASVNILIAFAIGWSIRKRLVVSYLLAALLLVPGIAFIWNSIQQFQNPAIPAGQGMGIVAVGALLINVGCALLIARHRYEEGGLVSAAYFSARNDAIANLMIIAAGIFTLIQASIWPDLIVGIVIFILNADAAKQIINSAKKDNNRHRA